MNWQKASYTIEAAVLVPLFFGILLFSIHTAIAFYEECIPKQQYDKLEIDVIETFYACQKWNKESVE